MKIQCKAVLQIASDSAVLDSIARGFVGRRVPVTVTSGYETSGTVIDAENRPGEIILTIEIDVYPVIALGKQMQEGDTLSGPGIAVEV